MARSAILPETALQQINLMVEEAWPVNQRQIDLNAVDSVTFDALLDRQRSVSPNLVQILENPNKDEEFRVYWNDFCGETVEECTNSNNNNCGPLTGEESEIDYASYTLDNCMKKTFKFSEETFAGTWMTKEQYIADNIRNVYKTFREALNASAIRFLQASGGDNPGTKWTVNGAKQTLIPSEYLEDQNTNLYNKITRDAQRARMGNVFLIDVGDNLWEMNANSRQNALNAEGRGSAVRASLLPVIDDAFAMGQVPDAEGSTFAVSPYAYAFVNKSYYRKRERPINGIESFSGATPVYDEALEKYKWFVQLPGYPIYLDVLMERKCLNGTKDRFEHIFQYTMHYDWLLNPAGCTVGGKTVTGIIEYANEEFASS